MSKDLFRHELAKALRQAKVDDDQYDQLKLARLSGVSQSHLSTILAGRRHASPSVVLKLADALGISSEDTNRWLVLNSLPEESTYALQPEEVSQMMRERFNGNSDVIARLDRLVQLTECILQKMDDQ